MSKCMWTWRAGLGAIAVALLIGGSASPAIAGDLSEKGERFGKKAREVAGDSERYAREATQKAKEFGEGAKKGWSDEGGGKKNGCFIATAVYGSYDHPDVMALRNFRDETLQHYAWGRQFIAWYYENGPAYAGWVQGHPMVATAIRAVLQTVVFVMAQPVVAILILLTGILGVREVRRRRKLLRQDYMLGGTVS